MPKHPNPEMYAMSGSEKAEQIALFMWCSQNLEKYPELKWLFAIPNGGFRTKSEAAGFKASGVKAGVPDTFLPVPRGKWAGLWVELKKQREPNKKEPGTRKEQKEWIDYLRSVGYGAIICYGWQEARDTLVSYLESEDKPL